MNTKFEKIVREIDKAKSRLSKIQSELVELEKQKTELENLEIIGLIRSSKVDINDLNDVLKTINKKQGGTTNET